MNIIVITISSMMLIVSSIFYCKAKNKEPKCQHSWKNLKTTDHYDISYGMRSYMYTTVRQSCSKCGVLQTVKLKG